MKRVLIISLGLFFSVSCSDLFLGEDPAQTPVDIFEEFWSGVDKTWPAFESKQVDWDSIYAVYRPQINSNTSISDLKLILADLVNSLEDQHTGIFPDNSEAIQYHVEYPQNFYGFTWTKDHYLNNPKANGTIGYGLINAEIGYIYIGNFSSAANRYDIIDEVLTEFQETKGIIIDVRDNGGGSSLNAEIIAGRFADQRHIYSYSKFRVNEQREAMGDLIPASIAPAGLFQYLNKVALLTNRGTFSATEDFTLMMKSFPQVIHLGDATGGGSETRPIKKELPGGWYYRVSSKLLYDLSEQPISRGIAPDIFVSTMPSDFLNGRDTIIEKAISELMK